MNCVNHPEIDAVGTCVKCGKELCIQCKVEVGGKFYCRVCADVYGQLQPAEIHTDNSASSGEVRATQRHAIYSINESKRRTAGNVLIVIGTIGCIIAQVLFFKIPQGPDAEAYVFLLVIPAGAIFSLFLIIGVAFRFTKSTAALIYGIFGLTGGLCSILAIAFGAMSLSGSRQNLSKKAYKVSIAGIILGVIGIVVWILWYFFRWRYYLIQIYFLPR